MVNYDPTIIHQHAARLYAQASNLVILYGLGFGLLGLIGGGMGGAVVRDLGPVIAVLSALIFGLLGAAIGRERGFELRLRAQTALCQAQIEFNTRLQRAPAQPTVR